MITDIFTAEVLNLPDNLKTEETYSKAIGNMGWKLIAWDETPLKEHHYHSPVRIAVETAQDIRKDFIILRSGNSVTFAIIKSINGIPHVMVRNEQKGTGIDITTMPSGYINPSDKSIGDGALRKLFEESGISVDTYHAVDNSAASIPNNSTNTSTSFIAKIPENSATPNGWTFIPLKDAPSQINHITAQQAAYAACAIEGVIPKHNCITLNAS